MVIHEENVPALISNVLGQRLRQARLMAHVSQTALGEAIGLDKEISSPRISRYESGVHEPPIAVARQLAQVLEVPLAFLYCDANDMALMLLHVHRGQRSTRTRALEMLGQR